MNIISLKEYARIKNISYEAVRKQLARYKDEPELKAHIIKDGRQQFLDEEAVAFLDARRMKNPVVIYQQSKDEAIAMYKEKYENVLEENNALYKWKSDMSEQIANVHQLQLAAENAQKMLSEKTSEVETVRKEASEAAERAETAEGRVNTLEDEKNALEGEIERLRAEAEQKAAEAAARAREEAEREFENRPFSEKLKDLFRKKGKYK